MQRDLMHLRLLSQVYYLSACACLLCAVGVVLWVAHLFDVQAASTSSPQNVTNGKWVFVAFLSAGPVFYITVISIVLIYTGLLISKMQKYRRCIILAIVTSTFNPLLIPLGIWALVVLCSDSVEQLFAANPTNSNSIESVN